EEPYLRLAAAGGALCSLIHWFDREKWNVTQYPYLAFRIRRIMPKPGVEARVELGLELASGRILTLNLTHPVENDTQMALPQPIAWRSNVWEPVIVDLRQVLPAKSVGPAEAERIIRALRITQKAAPADYELHIQSIFVFAPWRAEDQVEVIAFDASGIGGISWEGDVVSTQKSLAPAAPAVGEKGTGWLRMRVRDKAGNHSFPLHVPVVGTK
ncbi:MAG: hypothetical protein N2255_09100, partial [Kiritimatiellae bacterium]|nr:hypothetical protein [Kiritimatiellia bacterium]